MSAPLGVSLVMAAVLACGGCSEMVITPNTTLLPSSSTHVYSDADWAAVLHKYVAQGLVDYDALARERESLERYYALLSVTGPRRTPDQFGSSAQVTAYWINAYNALVLCAVMDRYPVATMYDLSLPRLEHEYKFVVDGRARTLAEIEAEILKVSSGDARALLATSRAALGTPRLIGEPFRPETLERQLAEAAAQALDNASILRIDHSTRSIQLWQLILQRQADFEEFSRTRRRVRAYLFNVLLDLASPGQRRALQSAVGYTVRQIPFDRTLNRRPGRGDGPVVP